MKCVGSQKKGCNEKTDIGADHKNITMCKIDEQQHAIDQSVPQCDQGIKAPPLERIEQILKE